MKDQTLLASGTNRAPCLSAHPTLQHLNTSPTCERDNLLYAYASRVTNTPFSAGRLTSLPALQVQGRPIGSSTNPPKMPTIFPMSPGCSMSLQAPGTSAGSNKIPRIAYRLPLSSPPGCPLAPQAPSRCLPSPLDPSGYPLSSSASPGRPPALQALPRYLMTSMLPHRTGLSVDSAPPEEVSIATCRCNSVACLGNICDSAHSAPRTPLAAPGDRRYPLTV